MPGETLRVVLGAAAGTEIPLDHTFTLGRTESGQGNLGGDPELSRQHARIARTPDGGLDITDLNSTNGTHVNGVRIAGSQRLNAGDTVRVGQTTINVHIDQAAGADRTVIGAVPQGAPPGLGAPPSFGQPTPPGFEQPPPLPPPAVEQAPPLPPPAVEQAPPPAGAPSAFEPPPAPPVEPPGPAAFEPEPPLAEPLGPLSSEPAPPASKPVPWWERPPSAKPPAPSPEESAPGAGAVPAGEVPLPPSPQPPSPGPGPGPPAPPAPDPMPPSPGPEPGPPAPPAPAPAPPWPGPPGPPPGPGPQIEHQPGPFGEPQPAEPSSPHGDLFGAPAGMTSGDSLGGTQGMPSGDPLGSAPPEPAPPAEPFGGAPPESAPPAEPQGGMFGGPPGGAAAPVPVPVPVPEPAPSGPPEGTVAFGPPGPSGEEATRFDAGPPPEPEPEPAPLPAAASVPQPAAPPPFAAPPIQEHGTQRYAAAPPAYEQPPAAAPSGQPAGMGSAGSAYELKRPIGRQVILYALSLGLWGFYWFYDTRKKLNGEMGKPDDAGVKTACLLIPIYNLFLVYQLWDDLNTVRTQNYRLPDLNVTVLLIVGIFVPFGAFWAFPKVANALNEYWDHRTQGQAREASVTGVEKVLACVGLGLLAIYLIAVIIIIIAVAA